MIKRVTMKADRERRSARASEYRERAMAPKKTTEGEEGGIFGGEEEGEREGKKKPTPPPPTPPSSTRRADGKSSDGEKFRMPCADEIEDCAVWMLRLKTEAGTVINDPIALKASLKKWAAKKDNWGQVFEYLEQLRAHLAEEEKEDLEGRDYRDENGEPISYEVWRELEIERELEEQGARDDAISWLKQARPDLYRRAFEEDVLSAGLKEARAEVAFKLRRLGDTEGHSQGDRVRSKYFTHTAQHDHPPASFWGRGLVITELRHELAYACSLILAGHRYRLRRRERARDDILRREGRVRP